MTIASLLWEKSERVIMTIPSPFWKGKKWWPWSYHSLLEKKGNNVMNMTITSSLLEKEEMMAMVRPFSLKDKEKNVMIMTITSSLLEKEEMMAMARPFSQKEKCDDHDHNKLSSGKKKR